MQNAEVTNPDIPLKERNLRVSTALTRWPKDKPLRASINNFGYGDTKAHIILESAPAASLFSDNSNATLNSSSNSNNSCIFILSSKDPFANHLSAKRIAAYIQHSIHDWICPLITDIAYTLAELRSRSP